jgi:ferredoxin
MLGGLRASILYQESAKLGFPGAWGLVKLIVVGDYEAPGALKVDNWEEATKQARSITISQKEKVILVGRDAWRAYAELASDMRMSGENYYFLEALDPRETELASLSWGRVLLARIAYTARREAEHAFSELGGPSKRVTRRALLRGAIVEASMEYTEKPIEDPSLCSKKAIRPYCDSCLSACGLEGGCPVSAALCGVELLYLPGYSRSGLRDALRSLTPMEKNGFAVFAPRSAMHLLLERFTERKPSSPVLFFPVSCPYVVGLEELLALHALGLEPVIVEAGWEPEVKRCKESAKPYKDMVESDYIKIAASRLVYGLDETIEKIVSGSPKPLRVEKPEELLPRGLRPLALAVIKSKGIAADLATGFSGVLKVDTEKCTLCGACAYECPAGALRVKETKELSALLFLHDRCIACGYCEEVCPEDALTVSRAVNAQLVSAWAPLAVKEILRCIVCGKPIGSASMIEKVIEKLILKGFKPETMPTLLMCEECKQKYALGMIDEKQIDYEALRKIVSRVRRRLGLETA